jgi:hypothetical protein
MTDTATITGHVLLFLTTVIGFVFQWLREERAHRWQQEEFRKVGAQIKSNGREP